MRSMGFVARVVDLRWAYRRMTGLVATADVRSERIAMRIREQLWRDDSAILERRLQRVEDLPHP